MDEVRKRKRKKKRESEEDGIKRRRLTRAKSLE